MSSNIAAENSHTIFGKMEPRLWISRLCRGYRKACEDVSHLKCHALLLGCQTHSADLGYWCMYKRSSPARVSVFLRNRLFKTPDSVESRSKCRPPRCALVTQCRVSSMTRCQILYNPAPNLRATRALYSMDLNILPKKDNKSVGGAIIGGAG